MKLLKKGMLYGMFVMLLWSVGFYIATHWLDNPGTVYVFGTAWLILTLGAGLMIVSNR
jgi:hypothetical protein